MSNGRKITVAALAAAISLAAPVLPAAPAEAVPPNGGPCVYDPWLRMWYRAYVITHYEPCTPSPSEFNGVCVYDELSGNWYRMYVTHYEPCDPPV